MVKPQQDQCLPEYLRRPVAFTDEEKENSTYYPLFEVPFWAGEIEDNKAVVRALDLLKPSHQRYNMSNKDGDATDQHSFPGGRPWNIIDSRTRASVVDSNGINILDDETTTPFVEEIQKNITKMLQHSPEKHSIHEDQIAISGAYVGHLPPGRCLEQTIAPNNELVGLLILETPADTGELYFQDPAWITKTMTTHHGSGSIFPSSEVTQHFAFDEGQIFLYPSWLPMSLANHRKMEDPNNTGIWFLSIRISTRIRSLNPAVIASDKQEELENLENAFKKVEAERDEYRNKLDKLGELD